jgi:hypothetical protein
VGCEVVVIEPVDRDPKKQSPKTCWRFLQCSRLGATD